MKIVSITTDYIRLEAEGQLEREVLEKWSRSVYGEIYISSIEHSCDHRDGNAKGITIRFGSPKVEFVKESSPDWYGVDAKD